MANLKQTSVTNTKTPDQLFSTDYLVIAGGGGSGKSDENGNTSGGGGAIITNDEKIYKKINYLSNQSKNDVVN